MIYSDEFAVSTSKETELVDITTEVRDIIDKSGIKDGIATIFSKHTTTAIGINENEASVIKDFEDILEKIAPKTEGYRHGPNAHSHIKSLLLGASETIPIEDGRPSLGTWQSIFFIELDGPRRRTVRVKVIGEKG